MIDDAADMLCAVSESGCGLQSKCGLGATSLVVILQQLRNKRARRNLSARIAHIRSNFWYTTIEASLAGHQLPLSSSRSTRRLCKTSVRQATSVTHSECAHKYQLMAALSSVKALVCDVNGTMFSLDPIGKRMQHVGLQESDLQVSLGFWHLCWLY